MKIALIGAGNVATHLGKALKKAGHEIVYVYSRSIPSAATLGIDLKTSFGISPDFELIKKPDLIIVSVSDHAIKNLLKLIPEKKIPIVLTSGSMALSVFGKSFPNHGVLYPLQTFSKNIPLRNKKFPIFIEANNSKTLALLKKAAASISKDVQVLDSESRKTLHVAAVFACNFTNHLFTQSEKLLKEKNLDFKILEPLLKETVAKALKLSPSLAQTGPAIRNDKETIAQHLKLLQKHPQLSKIYKLLSESISDKS